MVRTMERKAEETLELAWLNAERQLTAALEHIKELEDSLAYCNVECEAAMKRVAELEQDAARKRSQEVTTWMKAQ